MPKPDHEVARLIARAMTIGADPEDLLRIEAGARRRKPATPPHTMPEPRDPREPNPERVPFPPPQTRDAVSDFRARKLISRIERPAKIAEWLDLITDTVSAWADANRRASPTDQQVADWGGWSWNGSECYAPRWHHAPSIQRWRAGKAASIRSAVRRARYREMWIAWQRGAGRTNAALAGLFEVSVRTIQRAKAWGRDRCRGGVTAPCTGFFAPERKTAFKQLLQGAVTPPVKAPYMSLGEEGGAVL